MPVIWINGSLMEEQAVVISPRDRGFTLADGVFETMRCHGKHILWWSDHLQRFHAAAELLGISVPLDNETIENGLEGLLAYAGYSHSALRLTLTRGPSSRRGLWPPGDPVTPTMVASAGPLLTRATVRLIIAQSTRRNEYSPLSRTKSLNYGDSLLARREAEERGADEAVLLNSAGNVACCTVGNLFVRLGQDWFTPPVSDGVLPGLARERLIPILQAKQRTIAAAELPLAQAAIVSNSLSCALVTELDGLQMPDHDGLEDFVTLYECP
jgi:branched-chain amino acid aminotransferase